MPDADAQSRLWQNIKRRLFRKSKFRKAGKRLYRLGDRPPLKDFSVVGDKEVIGFEPSWLISPANMNNKPQFKKKYYFNLLTGLAIGEYDINPKTGGPRSWDSFNTYQTATISNKKKSLNIIQYGRQKNPDLKILMHITCHGDYGGGINRNDLYNDFFENEESKQILYQNIGNQLSHWRDTFNIPEYKLGVVLDFDRMHINNIAERDEFIEGYARIITELREEFTDTEFLIYCKIDPVTPLEAYLPPSILDKIEPLVDLFIVRGYGFEKYSDVFLDKPGPLSDILDIERTPTPMVGLDSTVNYYHRIGMPKDKMIIEYTYYGVAWERDPDTGIQHLKKDYPYAPLNKIRGEISNADAERAYKYNKDSTYTYAVATDKKGIETTYYFDSYLALDTKYAWTEDTVELKGIAINALGYNFKSTDENKNNWYAIANYYAREKPSKGWLIASFLLSFIPMGFLYAIARYWEVRNALAKYKVYYNWWRICFVISLIVAVICCIPGFRDMVGFAIGVIILFIFGVYIMIRRYLTRIRKYSRYVN